MPVRVSAFETELQRFRYGRDRRPLNFQQPHFGRSSARRGETSRLTAGGQDTMAGNDQRNGITSQSLSDSPGCSCPAELLSDLTVRSRLPGRDFPRSFINPSLKSSHNAEINRHVSKVLSLAGEVLANPRDDLSDMGLR